MSSSSEESVFQSSGDEFLPENYKHNLNTKTQEDDLSEKGSAECGTNEDSEHSVHLEEAGTSASPAKLAQPGKKRLIRKSSWK